MRVARRLLHVVVIVLTLIVGATAAAIIVSQTAWFKNWLRGYIVVQANKYLNGQLSIERLGGNLFFGVEMENIGISLDGSQVVAVEDLGLDYNVFNLITRGLSLDEIRVNKPVLYLRREGDTWSIARLVKKQEQEADRQGPQSPMAIDTIGINDASIVIDDPVGTAGVNIPKRIDRLDAELSFKYEPVRYSIEIAHASFRGSEPAIALNALSGGVAVKDDTVFVEKLALRTAETSLSIDGAVQQYLTKPTFKMQISSEKLSIPEIARFVPSLAGIGLQPAFEVKLDGPLDRLGVEMNVRSSAGQVTGTLVADVAAPGQSVAGDLSIRHLDLAPILNDPRQKSDLTADAHVDLSAETFANIDSARGTASVTAPRVVAAGYEARNVKVTARIAGRRVGIDGRASAYGADATAAGTVVVPRGKEPLSFDVRGQARRLNLRNLPKNLKVPPVETAVSADYHVAGTPEAIKGDARFGESTVPGATIAAGSTVGFAMRGKQIDYSADATVHAVDLQRLGEAFNVPALATDRYQSTINAHIVANGSGTTPKEMQVTASGTLTDSSLLGGRIPQLAFDASVGGDTAQVKANGAFSDLDPAVATGRATMKGTVGGHIDVAATIEGLSRGVTPDNVAGTVRLTLEPSTVGGLVINHANLDADYREQSGEIRQLEVVGRDLNVAAHGRLALNTTGQSDLTIHADTPSLEEIGKLVGTPVAGIAKVDARVTGNRSELQAEGTIVGNGIKYQENGALSLTSNYSARVPDLTVARATVVADTHATFVTVAGQNVNDLTAKTTYAENQVTFDVTARQPRRSLAAGGSLVVHPDHQEVHLQSLALETAGQRWALAPDANPTIRYAADALEVEKVRLVSADQTIAADGKFGQPGDALKVTLNNVDLATVDALLLRPPQFTGRLNASSTVSGTTAAPAVKGEFRVEQGTFRQFKYDSLGGTIDYSGKGVNLDARLQQNPTQWISANGYLPMALFSATTGSPDEGPASGDHHAAPAAPADRIDLTIESSPLDLGLIQGFTTAVTNVQGTLEAHVRVTGSAADPHPEGSITIANGAMNVEPTGVAYTNIAGQIELQPDRVHIEQITILDNHQSSLSVTGDLAIHERQVGGFQVWINADDFKVIDNKMGNVRIQSAIEVAGQLRSPIVRGDLGITTGVVNLDEIIAIAGTSPYPTAPTDDTTEGEDANTPAPAPSGFDALRMNLRLTVPNDLVVKASNLQTPGSPVSLGALNLTLGGDLTALKDPGDTVRLTGVVNTIRGNYDFQGRRFEILRDGTLRFEGLDELNPRLDIRTRRIIQAVEARVNIRGTLKEPEIVLTSTPPLEQADILSLIVFNQPLNQLGEGQQVSLTQRAQSLAVGAVAGQLAQSIGNALGLDTFEINLAPENGGGPEVTVGQQVGQNLYVKVQQGVGDQSTTNLILEYELTDWLRLQTNVVQGSSIQQSLFRRAQSTGADLIFFLSY